MSTTQPLPWFQVEFSELKMVTRVVITCRFDLTLDQCDDFEIHVGDKPGILEQESTNPICSSYSGTLRQVHDLLCNDLQTGHYFLVQKGSPSFAFSEIVIYGFPAG